MSLPPTTLDWAAKPLLLLHTAVSMALAFVLTRLAYDAARWSLEKRPFGSSMRAWSRSAGASYFTAFFIGLLMYPHYRFAVRGLYLDRYAIWASNLFDIKENLLGLGLPWAALLFAAGRRSAPDDDLSVQAVVAFTCIVLWLLVVAGSLMGFLVTAVKGV